MSRSPTWILRGFFEKKTPVTISGRSSHQYCGSPSSESPRSFRKYAMTAILPKRGTAKALPRPVAHRPDRPAGDVDAGAGCVGPAHAADLEGAVPAGGAGDGGRPGVPR